MWIIITCPVATITGSLMSSRDIGQRKSSGITGESTFLFSSEGQIWQITWDEDDLLKLSLSWTISVASEPLPSERPAFGKTWSMIPIFSTCRLPIDLLPGWYGSISLSNGCDNALCNKVEFKGPPYLPVARLSCALTKSTWPREYVKFESSR